MHFSYLFTPSAGNLSTLLSGDRLAHDLLVHGAVHCVRHAGSGCVLIVKITDRSILTHHLSHSHGYLSTAIPSLVDRMVSLPSSPGDCTPPTSRLCSHPHSLSRSGNNHPLNICIGQFFTLCPASLTVHSVVQ